MTNEIPVLRDDNMQAVFDYVVGKLAEQGGPARGGSRGLCRLRSVGGRKCAVGWLIPDDRYSEKLEEVSSEMGRLSRKLPGWMVPRQRKIRGLLDAMQSAHDNAEELHEVRLNFYRAAARFNMSPHAVDSFSTWAVRPT